MSKDTKNTGFSKDWEEDCMRWWGHILTGKQGHWCYEWDELPIDETCMEFEYCTCVGVEKEID